MPIVEYSQKDILQGTVVEPAWYTCKVDNVGEEPSKDKQSTNYPVEATIIKNGDTGDTKFAGVPIRWNFNSKAIGMSLGFLKSFGVEPQPGQRIDLAAAQGNTLDIMIGNKEYEGRILNDVKGYRPVRNAA
jgi:hypothetical protein